MSELRVLYEGDDDTEALLLQARFTYAIEQVSGYFAAMGDPITVVDISLLTEGAPHFSVRSSAVDANSEIAAVDDLFSFLVLNQTALGKGVTLYGPACEQAKDGLREKLRPMNKRGIRVIESLGHPPEDPSPHYVTWLQVAARRLTAQEGQSASESEVQAFTHGGSPQPGVEASTPEEWRLL